MHSGSTSSVRGRFAPSPTGRMHLGNAWASLLAWLSVRSRGGRMVLRIEDLDPDRSRPEYATGLAEDLAWLGLDWDEGPDRGGPYGPYVQSERLHLYDDAIERLTRAGQVYPCFCTRKELRQAASAPHAADGSPVYPGTCARLSEARKRQLMSSDRPPAIRVRCPDGPVHFVDRIRGPVTMTLGECGGDFAIRRSDRVHAYQLAVALDDGLMHIDEVVRGDDLLDSTPRQVLLYALLGLEQPVFAHVPLLVDAEGERLAKRHGHLELRALREGGVAPEAVVGWLARKAGLTQAPGLRTAASLVDGFDFSALPSGPVTVENDVARLLTTVR